MNEITFSQNLTPAQKKFAYPDEGRTIIASDGGSELLLVQIGPEGHWEAYTQDGRDWFSVGDHYPTRGEAMSFAFSWLNGDQAL